MARDAKKSSGRRIFEPLFPDVRRLPPSKQTSFPTRHIAKMTLVMHAPIASTILVKVKEDFHLLLLSQQLTDQLQSAFATGGNAALCASCMQSAVVDRVMDCLAPRRFSLLSSDCIMLLLVCFMSICAHYIVELVVNECICVLPHCKRVLSQLRGIWRLLSFA